MMPIRQISRLQMVWLMILAFLYSLSLAMADTFTLQPPSDLLSEQLRARIEAVDAHPTINIQGTSLHATGTLARLYRERAFQPVWITTDGLLSHIDTFLRLVRHADHEGLDPTHYHLQLLEEILQGGSPAYSQQALVDV